MASSSRSQPAANTPLNLWDQFGCLFVWQWLLLPVERFEALVPDYYRNNARRLNQVRDQRDALLAEHADYLRSMALQPLPVFPDRARRNNPAPQAFAAWHKEFLAQRGLESMAAEALILLSREAVVFDQQMVEAANTLVDMSRDGTSGNGESSRANSASFPAPGQVAPGTFVAPVARMVPETASLGRFDPRPTYQSPYSMNSMAPRAQQYENEMPPVTPRARAPSPEVLTHLGRVSETPMSPRTPMAPTAPLAPMAPMPPPETPPSPSPAPRFNFGPSPSSGPRFDFGPEQLD